MFPSCGRKRKAVNPMDNTEAVDVLVEILAEVTDDRQEEALMKAISALSGCGHDTCEIKGE
jgi:hypothetical protein